MIKDFCEKNNFLKCFKTSAKTGTNIEEAMIFLISNIVEKLEKISLSGNNPFEKRESLVLDNDKYKESNKDNNNNGCCWLKMIEINFDYFWAYLFINKFFENIINKYLNFIIYDNML